MRSAMIQQWWCSCPQDSGLIQPSFKALQHHPTLYNKSIHSATCHGLFHPHGQQLSSRIACVWCPHDCIPLFWRPTMEFASHGPSSLCHSSSTSSNDYRTTPVGFLPCFIERPFIF